MPPSRLCSAGVTLAMTTAGGWLQQRPAFARARDHPVHQDTARHDMFALQFDPGILLAPTLSKRVGTNLVQRLTMASKTGRMSRSCLTRRTWTALITR